MSLAKEAAKAHRVPKAIEHRAKAIMRKGHSQSSAYAIATKQSQREGRLKPGTHKLTSKGRKWERKHQKEANILRGYGPGRPGLMGPKSPMARPSLNMARPMSAAQFRNRPTTGAPAAPAASLGTAPAASPRTA